MKIKTKKVSPEFQAFQHKNAVIRKKAKASKSKTIGAGWEMVFSTPAWVLAKQAV